MEHKPVFHSTPYLPKDWKALIVLAVVLSLLPILLGNDYFLLLLNVMALNALVVLGLNVLIGSTGQVSMGHAAFYGLGAYVSSYAGTTWQWPVGCALLAGIIFVALAAFLIAIPTLRLEGHYLVMATLGFNIIVNILFNQMESITGGPSGFPGIPKIGIAGWIIDSDKEFYYFIWGLFLAIFVLTLNLNDSRLGRALIAIHEKELTAQALGIPTHRYKVAIFVLSAVYAAVAGFCYAHYVTFISPKTFDIFYSVQVVTMVVIGGMGSLWGGLVGVVVLTCLPELLRHFEDLYVLAYGLILMIVLVLCPKGLAPTLVNVVKLALGRGPEASDSRGQPSPALVDTTDGGMGCRPPEIHEAHSHAEIHADGSKDQLLRIRNISVTFGGVGALQSVDMEVGTGEIVALIGPNGAGKTTFLNVVSGLIKPQNGQVLLREKDLLGLPPHAVAARGIGRTFQAVQTYEHLSVIENVLLGQHLSGSSNFVKACLHTAGERQEESRLRGEALELLAGFRLNHKAFLPARQLPLLEQKLVELARALALHPSVLLLDEPVGGLSPRESEEFVRYIRIMRQQGVGVILVEHDMNVVMRIADRIVVLQHGNRIATGTPREIQRDAGVIQAYLGTKKG